MTKTNDLLGIILEWIREEKPPYSLLCQDEKDWIFRKRDTPVFYDDDWTMGFLFSGDLDTPYGQVKVLLYDHSVDGDAQEYSTLLNPVHPDFFDQILEILEKKCESSQWDLPRHHFPCSNEGERWAYLSPTVDCDNVVNFMEEDYRLKEGLCEDCWEEIGPKICAEYGICFKCHGYSCSADICYEEEECQF